MNKGLMSLVCVVLIMVCVVANSFGAFSDDYNRAIKYLDKPVPSNAEWFEGGSNYGYVLLEGKVKIVLTVYEDNPRKVSGVLSYVKGYQIIQSLMNEKWKKVEEGYNSAVYRKGNILCRVEYDPFDRITAVSFESVKN
jgi:hypothetical protein